MTTAAQVQALLRFLSKDAKVPLTQAMSHVKLLQQKNLTSSDAISEVKLAELSAIFGDEKLAKQVHNAAKRAKRKASGPDEQSPPSTKKRKRAEEEDPDDPAAIEESLALPESSAVEAELAQVSLVTNRAPLVLAFAVVLLKYTMPEQPISSRLSLAQALVSANSRARAANLGLSSGQSAEDEGWGKGQPVVRVLGRDISVLKRWGYEWKRPVPAQDDQTVLSEETGEKPADQNEAPALWGLDLEALKKSNGPPLPGKGTDVLPIYSPQSARQYLLRSFKTPEPAGGVGDHPPKKAAKGKASDKANEAERNLGLLLKALDIVFGSWANTLDHAELDRRAWSWYVRVRPDVQDGVAGWGEKGALKLGDILKLQRSPD